MAENWSTHLLGRVAASLGLFAIDDSRIVNGEPCVVWLGPTAGKGYGVLRHKPLHRLVWENAHGSLAEGLLVCHHCDNPPCINLTHLFVGSVADNSADMVAKARSTRGERNAQAKLTPESVSEIRALAQSGLSQQAIGRRFGITQSSVSNILTGKTWST